MILDTSFLIDLFAGHEGAFDSGVEFANKGAIQRVPAPVIMELSYGTAFASDDERRNVRNALRMYPVVEQSARLATRAGRLLAEADIEAGGESGIDKVDPMVAAVAEAYDEPVVTANVADFERLGVSVRRY